MFDKYQPTELLTEVNPDAQKTRIPADERLAADTEILGVFDRGKSRAYPIDTLEQVGLTQESVDGEPRVVLWHGPTHTAVAYRPVATPPGENHNEKARTVSLRRTDSTMATPFTDIETNSKWDIAGRAVDGELKGWTLDWLDGVQVKWFAWAAECPETSIYEAGANSR
jgi:hypothetical protein